MEKTESVKYIDTFFFKNHDELYKIAKSLNRQYSTDLVSDLYISLCKYKDKKKLVEILSSPGSMAYCANVLRNSAKRNYIYKREIQFSEIHPAEEEEDLTKTVLNEMDDWIKQQSNLHQLIWKLYFGNEKIKIRKLCRETGLDERYIRNKRNLLINEFKQHLQNKGFIE